jgi:hypothetical protein
VSLTNERGEPDWCSDHAGCCGAANPHLKQCRATHGFDPGALKGLSVHSFPIVQTLTESGLIIDASPPRGTEHLACDVFRCPIQTLTGDVSPAGCVLSSVLSENPSAPLLIDSLPALPPALDRRLCSGAPPQYEALTVGCWALDETAIIAVSNLLELPPSTYFALAANQGQPSAATRTCSSATDGLACQLPSDDWGTCLHAQCLERCVTASDCPPQRGRSRDPIACVRAPDAFLGVCAPASGRLP